MQNDHIKPEWQNIAETQSEHELHQGHSFWTWAYRIGVTGSFTALSMFIVERMSGTDAQVWDYTGGQALNGIVGLVFAFAFSVFVYGFYLSEYSIKQRLFVFAVAVMFPLFAEVSQTMHRGEETQKVSSESSPEFLAAQKALSAMTGTNPAAGDATGMAYAQGEKAKHEAELKACSRYTTAKKQANCQRYEQGKIAEADGKLQGYSAAGNAALSAHQGNITNMIGTIKELGNNADHAHPMVKLFMQFGFSLLVASLIMAVLIIGSIETALAWLGEHVKNYQKAMRARGLEIGNQKRAVVKVKRAEPSPSPLGNESMNGLSAPVSGFNGLVDSAKQTVGEYAAKVEEGLKAAPELIATEMMRADYANKQVLADTSDVLRNVGNKLDAALLKKSEGFKQSPEQLAHVMELAGINTPSPLPKMPVVETIQRIYADVKASGATSQETIQAAVFDAYARTPAPAELDDKDLMKVAEKITDKLIAKTPTPSVPVNQKHGATGLHNPALGTAEEHYSLPLPTVPVQSDRPRTDVQSDRPRTDVQSEQTVRAVTTVPVQSDRPRTDVQSEQTVRAVTAVPVQSDRPRTDVQSDRPRTDVQSEQTVTAELTGAAKQAEIDLYPQWLALVKSSELTAGARDAKRFISQATKNGADEYGLTIQEMQRIWASWQDRAARDGVLKANPKYQAGNRQSKYLLAA